MWKLVKQIWRETNLTFTIANLSTGAQESALIGFVSALKQSKGLVSAEQKKASFIYWFINFIP